jgi:hypothetical protein
MPGPNLVRCFTGAFFGPSPELPGTFVELIHAVRVQGLDGLITKRRDSRYEPCGRLGQDASQPRARVHDRRLHCRRPFSNLPGAGARRWSNGLTAATWCDACLRENSVVWRGIHHL